MLNTLLFVRAWLAVQANRFLKEERGAVNIVEIVLIIAVVVVLALAFKDALINLINSISCYPTKKYWQIKQRE